MKRIVDRILSENLLNTRKTKSAKQAGPRNRAEDKTETFLTEVK